MGPQSGYMGMTVILRIRIDSQRMPWWIDAVPALLLVMAMVRSNAKEV